MKIKLNTPEGGKVEMSDKQAKKFLALEANFGIHHEVIKDDAPDEGSNTKPVRETQASRTAGKRSEG